MYLCTKENSTGIAVIKLLIIILVSTASVWGQLISTDSLFHAYMNSREPQHNIIRSEEINSSPSGKCGFWINSQVRFHYNSFTSGQQKILKKYLDRPLMEKSIVSPSGRFRVHYNELFNAPSFNSTMSAEQNAILAAQIADSVYEFEVGLLGYPAPPDDASAGGDAKYDIYISNLYDNYGTTHQDVYLTSNTWTSYMEIDNDYSGFRTKGLDALRVTIAHEFFHAVQIGNYKSYNFLDEDEWFLFDSFSTAMEEFMYDDVNDYYNYISLGYWDSYFRKSDRHFSSFAGYGLTILPIYLKEKYGFAILKNIWEKYKSMSAVEALSSAVSEYGSTLGRELNTFGIWSYFTGYRKQYADPQIGSFQEGENYPLINTTHLNYSISSFPVSGKIPCVSNLYFTILVDNDLYTDTIVSIITDSNISGAWKNDVDAFTLNILKAPAEGAKHIANDYYSKIDAGNMDWFCDANIFNGGMMNGGELRISETDYAYPNPFNYTMHQHILLPAFYDDAGEARLYVYSAGMELIFDKIIHISYPHNKFIVEWDGLDSQGKILPSGVYIYIVESGTKRKTGKLTIFN